MDRIVTGLIACLLTGCAVSGPVAVEAPLDVSGVWEGYQAGVPAGFARNVSFALQQTGARVAGTVVRAGFPPSPVTGTVRGNVLTLDVEGSGLGYDATITGNRIDGAMRGFPLPVQLTLIRKVARPGENR